jgi:Sap, sulfolipid-1-addressing protein
MWCTVLLLALVATVDPVRLGTSVVLYSRPRPVRHLVTFWLGGLTISAVVALGVLFGMRDFALGVMHRVQLAAASSTAGDIQIAAGVLVLLIAAAAAGLLPRNRTRRVMPGASHQQTLTPTALSRLSTRVHDALRVGPPWVPFALGVGLLMDFRYLAALTAILASGAAAGTQVSAAALYTVVTLAFIEIPLASQLAAPARTGQVMSQVHSWVKARRQQVFALVIALLGAFLMTRGIGHA